MEPERHSPAGTTRRRSAAALFALVFACSSPARAQEASPSLSYCAPPIAPQCPNAAETYAAPARIASCKQEIMRYVKFVLAYRDCLIHESERAVAQANALLDRFKCASERGRMC